MAKATTVRFSDEVYARLDQASARTGMPVNSIVVAACLEWMQRHTPEMHSPAAFTGPIAAAPRWATIRRAVVQAIGQRQPLSQYPFERFTAGAQALLSEAQNEALGAGYAYIGTEHLLLACFADRAWQAAKILETLDVHEQDIRAALDDLMRNKKEPARPHIVPTSRVKKVIEIAFNLCGAAGDPRVSTGHLLLALATEGEGMAALLLSGAGTDQEKIRGELEKISEPEA
ncbi:MAG TPA: Clp protease N-terminal domain-containing protein [Candidatus Dormibacteraeota bacterium]|nr:Clp protease N-terminal domain-containing protein [Candidatus Dormibacteraeota bacterium]